MYVFMEICDQANTSSTTLCQPWARNQDGMQTCVRFYSRPTSATLSRPGALYIVALDTETEVRPLSTLPSCGPGLQGTEGRKRGGKVSIGCIFLPNLSLPSSVVKGR